MWLEGGKSFKSDRFPLHTTIKAGFVSQQTVRARRVEFSSLAPVQGHKLPPVLLSRCRRLSLTHAGTATEEASVQVLAIRTLQAWAEGRGLGVVHAIFLDFVALISRPGPRGKLLIR